MRLIDADELIPLVIARGFYYSVETDILNLIDNAPTVIDYSRELVKKSIELGHNVGYFEGKIENERPQGKWIIDGHHIRCNRCNEYICNTDREGNKIPDNFCPNCGADMRGETE